MSESRASRFPGTRVDAAPNVDRQGIEQAMVGLGLVDLIPDPAFTWAPRRGIQLWNPAAERLYGYARDEAVGRVGHDLLHTVFPDGMTANAFESMLAADGEWAGELVHRTRGGQRVRVDARMRVVAGRAGDGAGLSGGLVLEVNRDVTRAKRAEERARGRARQQEALIALMGSAAAAVTPGGLDAQIDEAVGLISELLGADVALVQELAVDGTALLLRGSVGLGGRGELDGTADAGPRTHAGFALVAGEPVVLTNVDAEVRFALPQAIRRAGVVSGLAVLIPGQGGPYGVLSAYARTPREFSGDEVHFLRAVANVIGGTVRDVRAMQALREGEERFRGIFEQAAVGIAQVSLDGHWLRVNAAMRRIAGRDLTGLTIREVTHPDDLPADLAHVGRLLAGEADSYTMDKRYVRSDGSVAWVTLNRSVVRDANRRPLYFVSVIEDVTERRAAEQALRDGAARMRAVVDTAVDTIITIDERGLVESINPAGCRLFGYTCDELVGRNVRVLMPAPYRDEHDGYLSAYLRTGVKRIIGIGREVVGRRKDGTTFPLDLAVSEFTVNGRRMFTGLIRDLTERRRLERQILDAGAEEQRRIGHDLHDGLCQQLTGLSFALEVLGQKLERRDAPETAGIRKVSELVDQAITQARTLAHGLQPVMLEAAGLGIALRELVGKAESMFHVTCLYVSEGEVLVHDNAVATHLYRIAQEAISNAVRHGKARTIVIDLSVVDRELSLTIADDGIGLVAAAASAEAAGRSKGIGLETMGYRARAIGGSLAVRPGERGGTVVTCTAPLLGRLAEDDCLVAERD